MKFYSQKHLIKHFVLSKSELSPRAYTVPLLENDTMCNDSNTVLD